MLQTTDAFVLVEPFLVEFECIKPVSTSYKPSFVLSKRQSYKSYAKFALLPESSSNCL